MSYDSTVASIFPTLPLRWKLDEAAGATVAVNSGSVGASANMTAVNNTMAGQAPLINTGKSYRFNDTATPTHLSSASAGNSVNGLSSLTIVLWFKYDQTPGNDFLVDASSGTITGGVSIRKVTGTGNIGVYIQTSTGATGWTTNPGGMTPGNTYCVALTWTTADVVKVYINGVKKTLQIAAGTAIPGGTVVNPADLYIGKWKSQVDTNLGGWMDDVLIAPKYLSDAEALQLYTAGTEAVAVLGTGATSVASAVTVASLKVGLSAVSTSASGALPNSTGVKQGVGLAADSGSAALSTSGNKSTASVVTLSSTTGANADGDRSLPPGLLMELNVQRNLTEAFINTMPVDITLLPRSRQSDGMGGYTWVDGPPRSPQTMRLIEYSNEATAPEPVLTADGHQRYVQYELLGKWDATIGLWDKFEHDGDEWEVVEMYFNNGWEIRAKVARFGNGGQP